MIKYNDDNIFVGYIKQLLLSFNLPMFKIYKEELEAEYKNVFVLENNKVYYYDDNGNKSKEYKNYKFNNKIQNLTTNFRLNSNIYDSHTHEYLGEFLRFIRDYCGIDLMMMYNCCSYLSPRKMFETFDNTDIKFNSLDNSYIIYMIPVKFNSEYTIALSCHSSVEIICGYCYAEEKYELDKSTYKKFNSLRFESPIKYKVNINNKKMNKENCLKLFIKIPTTCTSSLVVLEDVNSIIPSTGKTSSYVVNYEKLSFPTKLQLLEVNTHEKYLISDRLIEFLSGNVINPLDKTVEDIKWVQKELIKAKELQVSDLGIYGKWSDNLKDILFKLYFEKLYKDTNDLTWYVDKDVEEKLKTLNSNK